MTRRDDHTDSPRRRGALKQDFDKGMLARLADSYERLETEPPRSLPYWPLGVAVLLTALTLASVVSYAVHPPKLPSLPAGAEYEPCTTKGC